MTLNPTHGELEHIASDAGWDSYTLLLLISRWLEERQLSRDLLDHLSTLAAEEK